jgi:hypothetical protein
MRRVFSLVLVVGVMVGGARGLARAQEGEDEPEAGEEVGGDEVAAPGAEAPAAAAAGASAPATEEAPGGGVASPAAQTPAEAAAGAADVGGEEAGDGPFDMTPEQRAAYAAALRKVVREVRGKVLDKISDRIQEKQGKKLDRIALGLSIFACCGVFLLLLPFFLKKKYPSQMGVLFKYSALAALLFFLAVNLFSLVLVTMRGTQSALGKYTNPQVRLVSSTFDLIEDKADEMADIGPILIEPTLASLTGETDQPVLSIMLDNVQKLKNDMTVFTTVGNFFKKLSWLFGMLPILFIGLAIFLFAKVAKPTLMEIVRLPERAASGERGVVAHTVRLTLRNVWAEAKATFATVGVLVALTLVAAFLLGYVLEPAIEIFMAYLAVCFMYVQIAPDASAFWILFSLMGSILFLVLNLAVIILTTAFFLGKCQKIFQKRFREGVPLAAHGRFWKWGVLSALWAQVLPVLYILASVPAIGWFVEKSVDRFLNEKTQNWAFILGTGPAMFIVTFVLVFWVGRGVSALGFLARYKVQGEAYAGVQVAEDALATAAAAAQPGA